MALQVHQGVPLTVSMSAGRLDTLFPLLPHQTRCKLRVDSVGAFSVTDQVTADKTTRIIRGRIRTHEVEKVAD